MEHEVSGFALAFCVQVKHRDGQFPRTVAAWLDRVVGKARSRVPAKVGVLVVQRPRHRRRDALVVLTWADWCDLHVGRAPIEAPGGPQRVVATAGSAP